MIRHIVLMKWKENTPEQAVQAVSDAFARLPPLIPEIRAYQFGPDLGIYPGNADYLLVADFDDLEDFKIYAKNTDHIELMKSVSMPIMDSFNSAQFEI
jgi:hypothetical protein